ncbi:MAG: hypothetical protein U9Q89_04395 [Thermodesulfobacteriota bacterium]|nr:hypothetical protein [Thermodesulfobacteriota bacterium]
MSMDLIDFDVQLWVVRKDNGKMVRIRGEKRHPRTCEFKSGDFFGKVK